MLQNITHAPCQKENIRKYIDHETINLLMASPTAIGIGVVVRMLLSHSGVQGLYLTGFLVTDVNLVDCWTFIVFLTLLSTYLGSPSFVRECSSTEPVSTAEGEQNPVPWRAQLAPRFLIP